MLVWRQIQRRGAKGQSPLLANPTVVQGAWKSSGHRNPNPMATTAMAATAVAINDERNPSNENGKGALLYIAYSMRGFSHIPPNEAFNTAVYLIWLAT